MLASNALAYNEDDSKIVEDGRTVVKTLLKFIRLQIKNLCRLHTVQYNLCNYYFYYMYRNPISNNIIMDCHFEVEDSYTCPGSSSEASFSIKEVTDHFVLRFQDTGVVCM